MELQLNANMASRLLETIGPAIVRGDYDHQPFPNEAESISLFGVSRTVVREAVKSLMAKGLLESRPRIGTRVLEVSRWNLLDSDVLRWIVDSPEPTAFLRDYNDMRKATLSMAAGLAARSTESSSLNAIESAYMRLKLARDAKTQAEAVEDFHDAVIQASGNNILRCFQMNMAAALKRLTRDTIASGQVALEPYAAVVNAIRSRDTQRAETAMRQLLDDESQELARPAYAAFPGKAVSF